MPSMRSVENSGLAVRDGRNGRFGRGEDIREPQRKNIFPDEHDDGTSPLDGDSAEREAIQAIDTVADDLPEFLDRRRDT